VCEGIDKNEIIIAIDVREDRLENARLTGADYTILAGTDDVQKVKKITEGRGADFVVEIVGTIETYEEAFELIRPGGNIVAFGLTDARHNAKFNPFQIVLNEVAITGTVAGMRNDMYEAIRMIKYNRFSLKPFTSKIVPLENVNEAFNSAKNKKNTIKIIVSMF
jgi:threonine dehydrogenase-like Zn-dependent dehydrogenase